MMLYGQSFIRLVPGMERERRKPKTGARSDAIRIKGKCRSRK
jgi:hypothetical protein